IPELVDSDHVREREAFVPLALDGEACRMPGPPFRIAGLFGQGQRAAPRKGESNVSVYTNELGVPGAELVWLRETGVIWASFVTSADCLVGGRLGRVGANRRALAGTRIVDFGQVILLPFATRWLAWLGAEVILIESRTRAFQRVPPPFAYNKPGPNT